MRIAYLTQDFPPEVGAGPARVTEMALRWRKAGADVTIITGMPNRRLPGFPDGKIHPDYRGRLFMEEEWNGLRVLRSWVFSTPRRGAVWTVANNLSFMATSALHTLVRRERFDVLIASSPPFFVHASGEVIRRFRRTRMVLEIRDLWPDYLVQLGMLRKGWVSRGLFALERYLLKRAAHVVVVTESFRRRVIEKGVAPDRVDVIPNGVDLDQYFRDEVQPPIPGLERRNGEFIVGYLGTFGVGQALVNVIEAAALVRDAGAPIRFVLVGDGVDRDEMHVRVRELGVDNVSIEPPIAKGRTRAFHNNCDICLVPLAPIPVFQETIPSKLFEMMACERPVLACLSGEGARIVKESGGGVVVPPGDPRAMADGLLAAIALDPAERSEMGRRGRTYVTQNYDRTLLADRYLQILTAVVKRRDHRWA